MQKQLTNKISRILPGGRLEITRLPQCPEISLYLLNPEYPESLLSWEYGVRLMEEPMFWLFCWASGQALARYLLDNPQMVRGKRVLDFGCGSGVAAIAAAKAGARRVWACDLDPLAIRVSALNCRLNSVSVEVLEDWQDCRAEPDVILASDVLYDRENMVFLEKFIERSPEVLIADSRVKRFDSPCYRKIAVSESFTVPDLSEAPEFGKVSFYYASRSKIPG